MNFKDFFIKYKKLIITVLSSIILGTGIGIIGSPSEAEYNDYLTKNTELLSKITTVNTYIKTNEISIEKLTNKKSALQLEKYKIIEEKPKATEELKKMAAIEVVNKSKAEEESKVQAEEKVKREEESKLQETKKSKTNEDVDVHTKINTKFQSSI